MHVLYESTDTVHVDTYFKAEDQCKYAKTPGTAGYDSDNREYHHSSRGNATYCHFIIVKLQWILCSYRVKIEIEI